MAPVVAKKGSSTSKIAPEPSAPTGRIGSSKEVSCKSEPSGMASKSEPPGTALPAPRPFLSISNDLCGLVISSWLVPTVRRPRKGVLTFVGALLAQLGFLLYMVEIIIHGGKSTCETPALLQLVALYTFGSACAAGSHSDNLLQVALVCQRLRLPAAPVADSHGRLTQGSEAKAAQGQREWPCRDICTVDVATRQQVIIPVRPTSRRARMLLACAPLASMLIELLTLCVGPISSALFHQSMPLLTSSIHGRRCLPALVCDHRGADSKRGEIRQRRVGLVVGECRALPARRQVATNFVTQIDEVMLTAFVHRASRDRLSKYQYEHLWGVEEGDTRLKNVSDRSRWLARRQELLPLVLLLLATVTVGAGQAYGSPQDGESCSFVYPPEREAPEAV